MKQIFIDGRPIRKPYSGVAQYTARLFAKLSSKKLIFKMVTAGIKQDTFLDQMDLANHPNWENIQMPRKIWSASLRYAPLGGLYLPTVRNSDLIHITHFDSFPRHLRPNVKRVLTIHDMIFKEHPEWFTKRNLEASNYAWNALCKGQTDLVLAPSHFTKSKIREFGFNGEIQVTPLASTISKISLQDPNRFPLKANFQKPFVLFLGNLEPRKGISHLLHAWRNGNLSTDFKLIIIGAPAYLSAGIVEHIKVMQNIGEDVEHLGFVTEIEKEYYLTNATLLCYPSFSEGFGIPILDAMSLGTPVLTTTAGSIPEVCGGAAVLVAPNDLDELTHTLQRLVYDEGRLKSLSESSIQQSKQFSWAETARLTIAAYESLLDM